MTARKPPPEETQPLLFNAADVSHTEARDFYPTPVSDGVGMIQNMGWDVRGKRVFDPSCGHGNLLEAARLCGAAWTGGFELSPELARQARNRGHEIVCGDSLSLEWPPDVDFMIGNPPFSFALEFAYKLVHWSRGHGRPAAFLLELSFASSAARRTLHRTHPSFMHVFPNRIHFMGHAKAANHNYAVFEWGSRRPGAWEVW